MFDALEQLSGFSGHEADLSDLANALFDEFGGAQGLAKSVKTVFNSTTSGQTQANLLGRVMEVIVKYANLTKGDLRTEGDMTDEELLSEIGPVLKALSKKSAADEVTAGPDRKLPVDDFSDLEQQLGNWGI